MDLGGAIISFLLNLSTWPSPYRTVLLAVLMFLVLVLVSTEGRESSTFATLRIACASHFQRIVCFLPFSFLFMKECGTDGTDHRGLHVGHSRRFLCFISRRVSRITYVIPHCRLFAENICRTEREKHGQCQRLGCKLTSQRRFRFQRSFPCSTRPISTVLDLPTVYICADSPIREGAHTWRFGSDTNRE